MYLACSEKNVEIYVYCTRLLVNKEKEGVSRSTGRGEKGFFITNLSGLAATKILGGILSSRSDVDMEKHRTLSSVRPHLPQRPVSIFVCSWRWVGGSLEIEYYSF